MPAIIGRSGLPKSRLYTKFRKVCPTPAQWYEYGAWCRKMGVAKINELHRSGYWLHDVILSAITPLAQSCSSTWLLGVTVQLGKRSTNERSGYAGKHQERICMTAASA